MTVEEVIIAAALIERRVANIYKVFYEKFSNEKLTSYLWQTLMAEEEAHASFLDAELNIIRSTPSDFGEVRIDINLLDAASLMLDEVEARIKEDITLKDALSIALKIESDFIEKKYDQLIQVNSETLSRIFKTLTDGSDHAEKLALAIKNLEDK
jgi:bacterioferritin (cytochrome b1)